MDQLDWDCDLEGGFDRVAARDDEDMAREGKGAPDGNVRLAEQISSRHLHCGQIEWRGVPKQ